MSVSDIMRKHVVTARPEALVDDIAGELCDTDVGSVVVVEDSRPIGIITDRDISVRLDANWADARKATVKEVMTPDPVTVDTDASILEISRTMADHGVRRIPIVDDDELVGIITQDDLIVLLSKELEKIAGTIQAESPPEEWGRAY